MQPFVDTVELVKLYPGERVKAILFARKLTGLIHSKHCPAHAFHRPSTKNPSRVELIVRANGSLNALQLIDQAIAAYRRSTHEDPALKPFVLE
jgi:hypothetical protein